VRIRGHGNAWMALDVISFVIGWRSVWRHPKPQYWTACFRDENARQRLMCHSRASSSSLVVLPYRPNMTILPLMWNWPFYWRQFCLTTSFGVLIVPQPQKARRSHSSPSVNPKSQKSADGPLYNLCWNSSPSGAGDDVRHAR